MLLVVASTIFMNASCRHVTSGNGKQEVQQRGDLTIMFYNVENLFDTNDDPAKMDEDFTPEGKLFWTQERYEVKQKKLAEVISRISVPLPAIVGLCEVENRKVLDDLVAQPSIKPANYSIIHQDSPDERGIDVALLYNPAKFSEIEHDFYSVILPVVNDPTTRDILYVKGKLEGEVVHLFVNHWPSRSGGQVESEPNRVLTAKILRKKIEAIRVQDTNAKILCMGDFNDYPSNTSITDVLGAGTESSSFMFDYLADDHARKEGSYWYKGEWGALDQFIASWALVNATQGLAAGKEAAHIFKEDFLLFTDDKGNHRPNRTFAGTDYKGGYSDHLPIYIKIEKK